MAVDPNTSSIIEGVVLPPEVIAVQDANANRVAVSSAVSDELRTEKNQSQAQADAVSNALTSAASDAKAAATFENTQQVQMENAVLDVFSASGGAAAQVEHQIKLRQSNEAVNQLTAEVAAIQSREHTGIDIIDVIVNDFASLQEQVMLENAVQRRNLLVQGEQAVTQATSNAGANLALTRKTANQATLAANTSELNLKFSRDAWQVGKEQRQANAAFLTSQLTLAGAQLDAAVSNLGIARNEEQRAMQRTEYERRAEMSDIALESESLRLAEQLATSDTRVEGALTSLSQAKIELEASQQALDDSKTPEARAAVLATYNSKVLALEEQQDRYDYFLSTRDATAAAVEANANAAQSNARLAQLQVEYTEAVQKSEIDKAQALNAEILKETETRALSRAKSVSDVQEAQQFLFKSMDIPADIEGRLDAGDAGYELLRRLGALSEPNGQMYLGITPSDSYKNFVNLEGAFGSGTVNRDLTGVKILLDVKQQQELMWQEDPTSVPADEAAADIQFDKLVNEAVANMAKQIVPGDSTNVLQPKTIPELEVLTQPADGSAPAPGSLPTQPLFKLLQENGQVATDMIEISKTGLAAVVAERITLDQLIDGVHTIGQVTALDNNINNHGLASIGLPNVTPVRMRMPRPRGYVASLFDEVLSGVSDAALPSAGVGAVTAAKVLGPAAFTPAGAATVGVAALGTGITSSILGSYGKGSDFVIVDISDKTAVTQYYLSAMSSTTIGGQSTPEFVEEQTGE